MKLVRLTPLPKPAIANQRNQKRRPRSERRDGVTPIPAVLDLMMLSGLSTLLPRAKARRDAAGPIAPFRRLSGGR